MPNSATTPAAPSASKTKLPPAPSASKRVARPIAKPAAKPVAKVAAKPVAKQAGKAASKPATKPVAKPAGKPAPAQAPKPAKLVRDSFTMPAAEYEGIARLKSRLLAAGRPTKKSELLRSGLAALASLSDAQLLAAVSALVVLKVGRRKKR